MTKLSPTVSEAPPTPPVVASSRSSRSSWSSWSSRSSRSIAGLLLGVYAFVLCAAWSNRVVNGAFAPKAALDLLVLGPGLVALAWLIRRRDPAAIAATVFLGLAGLAAALATEPMMAVVGEFSALNGLLLVAVCVAAWALGRSVPGASPFVETAILGGAILNAAVGWLQVSTDLGITGLEPFKGRAQGLMGNPVFFAGLCLGALWIALARERDSERPFVFLLLGGFLAGAIELSGSRISLAVALGVVLWFTTLHARRQAWLRAGFLVLAFVVGVAVAMLVSSAETSSAQRVSTDASAGLAPRLRLWQSAIEAVGERPVLGYGPGRSNAATSPRRTLSIARYEGPDVLYSDTHNFLVEELTATGMLGLAALLTWLVLAGRRVRGPLAGFAGAVAVTMLFEPLNVGLTPLVLLAFGVAGHFPRTSSASDPPGSGSLWYRSRPLVALATALFVVGAALGAVFLAGGVAYRRALDRETLSDLATAARRFPPWPQMPGVRAQILNNRARSGGSREDGRRAISAELGAIARDSEDPLWWSSLGLLHEQRGNASRADAAFREAIRRNPWSATAHFGRFRLAIRAGDIATAVRIREKVCRIGPTFCPPRAALNQDPGDSDP